jgi:hypothetical protein
VILKSQACLVSARRERPAADAAVLAEICARLGAAVE